MKCASDPKLTQQRQPDPRLQTAPEQPLRAIFGDLQVAGLGGRQLDAERARAAASRSACRAETARFGCDCRWSRVVRESAKTS